MIITTPTIEKINDLRPHSYRLLTRCSSWSDSRVRYDPNFYKPLTTVV